MAKATKEKKALSGRRVVITRSKEQSGELRERLEGMGAEVLSIPLIQVKMEVDKEVLGEVLTDIGTYSWILFTSMNGVRYFFEIFFKAFEDIRSIGGVKIGCIGKATAEEVRKYYLGVDYVAEKSEANAFFEGLMGYESLENERVLVITGNLNRETLVRRLEKDGLAIVDTLRVYKTEFVDVEKKDKVVMDFCGKGADAVVFTSGSCAEAYHLQGEKFKVKKGGVKPIFCSIGPATTERMEALGMEVGVEAEVHSIEGVVESLVKCLNLVS